MSVRERQGRIVIDFYFYLPDGRKVRAVEREAPYTKDNWKRAHQKWKSIQYFLKQGTFSRKYLEFFPHGSKVKYFKPQGSEKTLREWWDEWLEEKTIRSNTNTGYQVAWKRHIEPALGHLPLGEIGEHTLSVFRKDLLDKKALKASSVNAYMKALRMCLRTAFKRGLISDYPAQDLGWLKEDRPEIDPFSFDELKHWLEDLKKRDMEWHDLVFFWSRTGLRPAELYALKWEDVDFFNLNLTVQRQRLQSGQIGPTKSRTRDVSIKASLEALKRQEARSGLQNEFIWLNHNREPWKRPTFTKKWRHFLKLAKLKYRPPVQMRHTFATLHIAAGESITWVSRQMGHADPHITWKRYNRYVPDLTRSDGSAFEKMMEGENEILTSSHSRSPSGGL